ncbi:MAG: hypothetical protein JWL70_1779 [Acidimicrobiia bacterium]|nr:hypothetical protein [Acidimicrobiia bacterium]
MNVVVRSEELPVFARLGPHRRDLVRSMEAGGELFEYWGHEASLLPVELEPLLRWKMARAASDAWRHYREVGADAPFLEAVMAEVAERGPLRAGELSGKQPKKKGSSWWGWDRHKAALEYLFWCGLISARRQANFERVYDLTERIIPPSIRALPTPSEHDARKELLVRAAGHVGVGTARHLADYHRQPVVSTKALVAELVDDGRLDVAHVEGCREPAYLVPGARIPRLVKARALLSPFDSLVWERSRTETLWRFHYRIEIYVPAAKRVHGYYVLPFLLDEALVGRVDLKADRARSTLMARAAYAEPDVKVPEVAAALAAELRLMATWLELDHVEVGDQGDLSAPLKRAIKPRRAERS